MAAGAMSGETPWRRVQPPDIMRDLYPGTRAWQREVHDGHLSVFAGREPIDLPNGDRQLLWHLSISHRTCTDPPAPGRYPTWDEIRQAREEFVPDEVTVAMLLPPKAEYINEHPTTFHLWQVDGYLPQSPEAAGER
jgi:hypothetical protein